MIRTVVTPKKKSVSFDVPQSYIGKEIEIIAFAKDEGSTANLLVNKAISFKALTLDTRLFKFNREEANER